MNRNFSTLKKQQIESNMMVKSCALTSKMLYPYKIVFFNHCNSILSHLYASTLLLQHIFHQEI